MRLPRIVDYFYLFFLLATLNGLVAAWGVSKGVSKRPGPSPSRSRVHPPPPPPTPTPPVALCKKNPVQCCNATFESNSTEAVSLLERLGIKIPEETVEVGFNCTSMSDDDVIGGFCDESILCCRKLFNDTLQEPVNGVNKTVGLSCTDVGL